MRVAARDSSPSFSQRCGAKSGGFMVRWQKKRPLTRVEEAREMRMGRLSLGRKVDLLADLEMLRVDAGIGRLDVGERDAVGPGHLGQAVTGLDGIGAIGGNRAGSGTFGAGRAALGSLGRFRSRL